MALSIGVSVGVRISVGDSIVKVKAIKSPTLMVITVDGGSDIPVTDNKAHAVEILPDVRVFVGLGKNGNQNRLAFNAPKSVTIRLLDKKSGQTPQLKSGPTVFIEPMDRNETYLPGAVAKKTDSLSMAKRVTTAPRIALLAPVPKEHLDDGLKLVLEKGKVAFGSMKWETFRDLDELRAGMPVDVYIYESEGAGKFNSSITWHGRYIFHEESDTGTPPAEIRPFRPDSTFKYEADNQGHWAVFWVLDLLEPVPPGEERWVGEFTGYGKKKAYGHSFSPEGPILIERP